MNYEGKWEGEMCCALIHPDLGHWCGYIAVPEGHPWFGKDDEGMDFPAVHGGITYTSDHKPHCEPDGLWWIGFDCAHLDDYVPGMPWQFGFDGRTVTEASFKELDFVQKEIMSLMKQALEARKEDANEA